MYKIILSMFTWDCFYFIIKDLKHMDQSILKVDFHAKVHTDNLLQFNNLNTSAISRNYPRAYKIMTKVTR